MTIPTKTALGQDELKRRTLKLGQRHRTILFLVDGRRPLSEVLSLAHQAGAATSHFEDLVRLGLVDVPAEPASAAAAPQPEVTEVTLDVPVESAVPQPVDAPSEPPTLAPLAQQDPAQQPPHESPPEPQPEREPLPQREREPLPEPEPLPTSEPEPVPAPEPLYVTDPLPVAGAAAFAPSQPPVLDEEAVIPATRARGVQAPPAAPEATPPPGKAAPSRRRKRPPRELPVLGEDAAVDPLQQIRDLLIDTLRLDAPLFSARMFMRVRNAQTTTELIDLVWDIQDHLHRARHAQRELRSLQRARELLGLGNTLVAEDSTRPPIDD